MTIIALNPCNMQLLGVAMIIISSSIITFGIGTYVGYRLTNKNES